LSCAALLAVLSALPGFVAPLVSADRASDPAAVVLLPIMGAVACPAVCAMTGADSPSATASTPAAHDAANTPLGTGTGTDLNTERVTRVNDTSGERENSGDCGKRETKREPRQLRDKEIGNVVGGQRNMPEILSPCG
jgi:hypothetical protein